MEDPGIKPRALNSIQSGILRYWVEPLEERILPYLARKKRGSLQKLMTRLAAFCAHSGSVAVSELRLEATRMVGPDWSVSYIGSGKSVEDLAHILFPAPPQTIKLHSVSLWQAPGLARKFMKQGDLVVCELNQILHLPRVGADVSFTVPAWVAQVLEDIDRPMDEILANMNQTMRRRIRRLETRGYHYVFTKAQEDLDFFYHRMYYPYITSRHGPRADLRSYDFMNTRFKNWGLILVKEGENPICGMLCWVKDGNCEALEMGVLDGRYDLVKEGSNVALWWFMLDWARRQGFRRYYFGASLAHTADGVFNFKRQWGTRLLADQRKPMRWSFYSKYISSQLREHLDAQGFIAEAGGKHYRVLLPDPGEPMHEADLARRLEEAADCGLDGVVKIFPKGSRELIACKPKE